MKLWNDPILVQARNDKRSDVQETADYFFQRFDAIFNPTGYLPNSQDILYARIPTNFVSESSFEVKDNVIRIFDVPGQRSLRLYWAPYLDEKLNSIIFVAAPCQYDQMTEEDSNLNKVVDSLQLFSDIVNNKSLKNAAMIIFLNKADLLQEKLKHSQIKDYFPDFIGIQDIKTAKSFFKKKFIDIHAASLMKESKIFVHSTTNTDKNLSRKIINIVAEFVIRNNLKDTHFGQE